MALRELMKELLAVRPPFADAFNGNIPGAAVPNMGVEKTHDMHAKAGAFAKAWTSPVVGDHDARSAAADLEASIQVLETLDVLTSSQSGRLLDLLDKVLASRRAPA